MICKKKSLLSGFSSQKPQKYLINRGDEKSLLFIAYLQNLKERGAKIIPILSVYKLFNNNLKIFKHNKVGESDFNFLVSHLNGVFTTFKEGEAHIIASNQNAVAYKVNDEIYFIPAKLKAVINNGDNKLSVVYDYPCEMKREDLIEL